jgi:hypothetical protein
MKRLKLLSGSLVCTALVALSPPGSTRADRGGELPRTSGYAVRSSVFGVAGSSGSAGSYRSSGTLGQSSPIGLGSVGNYGLSGGFWQGWLDFASDVLAPSPQVFSTQLYQSRPNPTSGRTVVTYSIAQAGPVEITVYDVAGRTVRHLADGHVEPGPHSVLWDGRDDSGSPVSSGIYFCRFRTQTQVLLNKMLILN